MSAQTRFLPRRRTVKTLPRVKPRPWAKRGHARTFVRRPQMSGRKGRPDDNFPPKSSFMTSLLPTLFVAGGSLNFFVLFIVACLSSFTPRRLQLGVELPALGFIVPFDTAPRTEPSALRHGSLAVFAILLQMSRLATFETSSISICSMRRKTGFSYLNLFRRLFLTLEETHGGLLFKRIDLNPLRSLEYKPQ
jgi:hypothetical protein